MKELRLLSFLCLVLSADAEESRLGSNLDFELSGTPSAPSWSRPPGGYEATLDTQDPASGKQSLRIRYVNATPATTGSFGQSFPAGSLRGKRIVLSGSIKVQGIQRGNAALWVRADDASRQMLALGNSDGRLKGTAAWQRYETWIHVSPAAETIVIGGVLNGDGSAWFDDLRLSVEEPKTGYNLNFEESNSAGEPKEWSMLVPRVEFRAFLDSDHPHSGKHSLCVDIQKTSDNGRYYVVQHIPAWKLRSKLISLSGYIRTENVTTRAYLYVYTLGVNHGFLMGSGETESAKGTSPWTKYEVEHFVSPLAETVVIGAMVAGSGRAWFDDFHIEVLEIH